MKKVSLIIPVYNAGSYFADMLESILTQTYPFVELIVVDDGSTDDSAAVFRQYEGKLKASLTSVQLLSHEQNQSASQAMNTALLHCTGEYLMWADADDILAPENIFKKVEYLEKHQDLVLVRANGMQKDLNTGEVQELARPEDKKSQSVFAELMFSQTYCHCGCYMVRSKAFFSCYPDRRIPVSRQGQNMQMLLPPASLSDCGYLDEVLYTYRIHTSNHSRSFKTYVQNLERLNGFEAMQLEILPHCKCERDIWESRIRSYWKKEKEQLKKRYLFNIRWQRQRSKKYEEKSRNCNFS